MASGNGKRAVYLDHAAAAPIDPGVLAAMLPYFGSEYGNPSSLHASGRRAARAIAAARGDVAATLGCAPEEIVFTGSGTESDNLAVRGAALANRARGNHVIVSAVEHKAVLDSARRLAAEGFSVSVLPVDRHGLVDVDACLALVRDETVLVSVMYANNEVGTVEPIRELAAALCRRRGSGEFPLLHTDACQAAGFLPLDVGELGVDLMTLNGSKIYGPRGIGALYKRRDVRLEPLVVGGEQEWGLRAGTESVPLIVGFAAALRLAEDLRAAEAARLAELRDYLSRGLLERVPGASLNGHPSLRLPNNVSVSVPRVEGESMLLALDALGVEASTGSACSARDLRPSHVLLALGQDAETVHGSVRFSLGRGTTREDLDYVLDVFPSIARRLAQISALNPSP